MKLTRRNFLEVATGASALALAACANSNGGGNFRNSAELAVIPVTSLRNGN